MSQLDTEHRSTEEIHENLEAVTSDMAEAKEKYTGGRNFSYSDEGQVYVGKMNKLQAELRYAREKEFLESLKIGDKITVLGNPHNGYRPTRLLAQHNEAMRVEGRGALDIVELEVTGRDTSENNSGILGKNVHGKKMMKGVLVPRPQYMHQNNVDPVYFYWLNQK